MSFHSARFLQDVNDQPLQYNGGSGWQQIGAGLQLVAGGYCVLLLGSAVGGALIWLALSGPAAGDSPSGRNPFPHLAALALVLTAVCSYGLVLSGQWRCLMYAPQRHNAKELMYICFHCLIVGSILNGIGAWLDGGKTYAALQQGWAGLEELDVWSVGNLMQVGSVLLGVAGSLVFSRFLRNVAECFNDRRRAGRGLQPVVHGGDDRGLARRVLLRARADAQGGRAALVGQRLAGVLRVAPLAGAPRVPVRDGRPVRGRRAAGRPASPRRRGRGPHAHPIGLAPHRPECERLIGLGPAKGVKELLA